MFAKCRILPVFFMFCVFVIAVADAEAIPVFARQYKISCSTCHAPFPKLKEYGEDFAGAGMILKEEESERDYVPAGDDLLKLNRDFPIGARFDAYAVLDEDDWVGNDLQSPWGLKLLSGGTLYKNIGYYFYFYMSERGEVAGIEDAYIHFDNVFNSELDIMVGQFQTSDPLMKRELRLTFQDYLIYKQKVGMSHTNLAYDRGIMLVYGFEKTGTELIGLIVNGNGKEEAGDNQKFDQDKYKNFGLRVNQSIFGLLNAGVYYYIGRESMDGVKNEITYWGPDFNIGLGKFELTTQYLERKDTNPWFVGAVKDIKTDGIVAELIFSPKYDQSRFYFTALYNRIESDIKALEYEAGTLSASYLLARNLRLIIEYTRNLTLEKHGLVFGMVSGF